LTQVSINSIIHVQGVSNLLLCNKTLFKGRGEDIEKTSLVFLYCPENSDNQFKVLQSNFTIKQISAFAMISSASSLEVNFTRFINCEFRIAIFFLDKGVKLFCKYCYFIETKINDGPNVLFYAAGYSQINLNSVKFINAVNGVLIFLLKNSKLKGYKTKVNFCKRQEFPSAKYFTFLSATEHSTVLLKRAHLLCMATYDFGSTNYFFNSNIAVTEGSQFSAIESFFGFNTAPYRRAGVLLSMDKASIDFSKCIFLGNVALAGGVLFVRDSLLVVMNKNRLLFNRGKGAWIFGNPAYEGGKGGVFFIEAIDGRSAEFHLTNNLFYGNRADIGGLFFTSGQTLTDNFYTKGNNLLVKNKANFYGKVFASDPVTVALIPKLDTNLAGYSKLSIPTGEKEFC
jgi:hypothetical protein